MPAISKEVFNGRLPGLTCAELLHPNTSCSKKLCELMVHTTIGSSRFFLLIYVLQSILKWKKLNRQFIIKQIKAYLRSILYGVCYVTIFFGSACLVRRFTDRYHFYSIALSAVCGGLAIFVESQQNRSLDTAIFVNLVAETVFRYLYWKNNAPRNALNETFFFMICSALVMYLLKAKKTEDKVANLWFYYPSRSKPDFSSTKGTEQCSHKSSCYKHVFEGFYTYFAVGYLLQLVKYLVPRVTMIISSPFSLLKAILHKNKFLFALLFGSYAGIYRIVCCILRRKDKEEKPFHSMIAGFLAGFSYLFKPTFPIAAIAFTTALQLLFQRISYTNELQSKLPVREILFALSSGFLLHNRFFLPDTCPKYVKSMLTTASNGQIMEIYGHVLGLLEKDLAEQARA